ncbi:efflux transporter outer membrane subunit [Conchiformibius kuhniae]|uniref:Efflux transporter outer membrane subunit n=1 Tax=Conchiformibius kuhniae TaxID=211502 RepID=A0ABD8B8H6_9NEIS|nr:efflux transporter outer membrane subunit [Conchiformibius kuhniae]
MNKYLWVSVWAVLSLGACSHIKPVVKLAPDYRQPQVAVPETFRYDTPEQGEGIQAASLGWQDYFADPRLHALIELALKNNTDLRTAALNVEQVRAQYAIARTAEVPNLGANGSATRRGNDYGAASNYSIGLGVSNFELDLWGRVRNASDAALQQYFATAAAKDAAHLSLIAAVAKAHFNEIYADASLKLAERVLAGRQETYRLTRLKHKAGVVSAIPLREQEALIEAAKNNLATAAKGREQARNALALLIAQPLPANLPKPLALDKQYKIKQLPAGLSSQLLLNRPDIRAAEYQLRQANANIGVARAALFPTIGLTGSIGLASGQLGQLLQGNGKNWSFGGVVSVPIFDWGRNRANIEAVKIAQEKTVVAYEAAVRAAFRDVSDALVARAALQSQYQSNIAQRNAHNERLRLVKLRYKHGAASSLDLLDGERSSHNAESGVLATQLSLLENMADLYKALGGGLKRHTRDDAPTTEAPPPTAVDKGQPLGKPLQLKRNRKNVAE